MHDADYFLYKTAIEHAQSFDLVIEDPPVNPTFLNMTLAFRKVGSFELEVIHTPGHSPGSVSFYNKESNIIFSGDLIFEQSVGRTDLPGSSFQELENSIINEIYSKGDACTICPGHGEPANVGREKKNNPFIHYKG